MHALPMGRIGPCAVMIISMAFAFLTNGKLYKTMENDHPQRSRSEKKALKRQKTSTPRDPAQNGKYETIENEHPQRSRSEQKALKRENKSFRFSIQSMRDLYIG